MRKPIKLRELKRDSRISFLERVLKGTLEDKYGTWGKFLEEELAYIFAEDKYIDLADNNLEFINLCEDICESVPCIDNNYDNKDLRVRVTEYLDNRIG